MYCLEEVVETSHVSQPDFPEADFILFREHLPLFGATKVADFTTLSDQQKRDRYFSHTAQCRHCMRALAIARIVHMVNPIAVFISFIFLNNKFVQVLVLIGYFLVNRVVESVEKALITPEPWVRTSAAQFS